MQTAALLFAATYILLLVFTKYRAYVCVVSAALFILLGILPPEKALACVDLNVILTIVGTMGIMYLFCASKMPALLADIIVERSPGATYAAVALSLFAGAISAFVDNVATVLMVAPVALSVARRLKIDPCPMVVAVSVASNLQGAATLVGDTTSIMLAGSAGMDFSDFFFFHGRPGLFWIVEVSALAATLVLLRLFRGQSRRMPEMTRRTEVSDYFPTALIVCAVLSLAAVSFIPQKPPWANGAVCAALFLIGLMRDVLIKKSAGAVRGALSDMDLATVCVLACLFVIVGGMTEAGVIDAIAGAFVRISGSSLFLTYTLVVWFSVAVSAVVD
ncbi:MAG: arsenic transporter, partial [Oscillospiraceae bacterium]|nr:arsenic transporter [Oscillospiraceae bacterium]